MSVAGGTKAAGGRPLSRGGIVELGVDGDPALSVSAGCHQDTAISQQGGGMTEAFDVKTARGRPGLGLRLQGNRRENDREQTDQTRTPRDGRILAPPYQRRSTATSVPPTATPTTVPPTATPTPVPGTITIIKDASSNTDFSFSGTGGLGTFALCGQDPGDCTALSNTKIFSSVAPGTYVITETGPSTWVVTGDSDCEESGTSDSSFNTGDKELTIELQPGETVICTFVNEMIG